MQTNIGISESHRQAVSNQLKKLLADELLENNLERNNSIIVFLREIIFPISDEYKDFCIYNYIKSKIPDIPLNEIPESLIEFWTNKFKETSNEEVPKQEIRIYNEFAKIEEMIQDSNFIKTKSRLYYE